MNFVHVALPSRVVFRAGSRNALGDELDRLGVTKTIIYSTPEHAAIASELARALGDRAGFVYPGAKQSTRSDVTHSALLSAQSVAADGLVAVGGDAAMNLSKAVALRSDLPQICIPMSFGGSEVSPVLRETESGYRVTRRSPKVMPETVLYDPELTAQMAPAMAVSSAFTAIAHAIEALYARRAGPVVAAYADKALADMGACLVALAAGGDADTHETALTAAWLAGNCLGSVGLGLHHQLCYVLAEFQDIPVEDLHAVLLPHTTAYNRGAADEALARAGRQLGLGDTPQGLYDLCQRFSARPSLKALGVSASDLGTAVDRALEYGGNAPRPPEREAIGAMLARAFDGVPPV